MPQGSHAVDLVTDVWVQVTGDTISPFLMINDAKAEIMWIASTTQPVKDNQSLKDGTSLQPQETMSRFAEMDGCHLYILGESGQSVVMVDGFRP